MKTVKKKLGLFARLSTTAVVLLFAQQALAVGTDPGVTISNSASVDYDVNSVAQATINSAPVDFLVDRRVDFTVTSMGVALAATNVGDTATDVPAASNFLDFYVTNLSNGTLDFNLDFAQMIFAEGDIYGIGTEDTGTTTGGGGDDVDMANVRIRVSSALDPAGVGNEGTGPEPALGDPTLIDDLPEDRSIRVRIYADTPGLLANLDIAGLRLLVTAAAPNAVPLAGDPAEGTALDEDTGVDVPGEVDNVFANASGADGAGNATEDAIDGFLISSAALGVTKAAEVTDDPFGGAFPNAKAVPGATITYLITLDNSTGGVDATAVSISDLLQVAEVAIVETLGVATVTLTPSVGPVTTCDAETNGIDGNGDGCVYDATADTLDVSGLTVPATQTLVVSFQVNIL